MLGGAIALLILGITIANGGGISQKVSQSLGLKDGVIELYNQKASTNKIYAEISGVWASDRTSADGKYLILGTEGSEFVVSDKKGIYKTGEQIITSKVSTVVGVAAKTEIKTISFDDEEAVATLQQLRTAYKDADIFLNGELTVDFPEDIKIPIEPNQMVTAQIVGSSLKLNYCGLERAIAFLKDQFAIGTLEIKVVQTKQTASKS